ncbi:adhesion g protein-coupled receptor l3 [Plakobranchus ocellatus]|uniref:Adhesion g protein-coupled receptor l3 n=1 Tax=Plakobranchus ocellatus TaxID=259542 RepID=A0AAV3YDZ3_9GAST|nr:adhesion g protein-coupled receptor l3 [Plakobranchus ocellatus]
MERNPSRLILLLICPIICSSETTSPRPLSTTPVDTSPSFMTTRITFGRVKFPWKTGDDPLAYSEKYCMRSCGGPEEDVLDWDPRCYPCSCSDFCEEYGTCCPNRHPAWAAQIFDNVKELFISSEANEAPENDLQSILRARDQRRDLFTCETSPFPDPILVVSLCPKSEPNTTLVDLCENDLTDSVDRFVPVSDQETGVTYRNIFCLKCSISSDVEYTVVQSDDNPSTNSLTLSDALIGPKKSFQKWSLTIRCDYYQTLYHVISEDVFLKETSAQSEICTVSISEPLASPPPESCFSYEFWPREKIELKTCNNSDPMLLWLCLLVDELAFSTSEGGHNLFCMLCRGETPSKFLGKVTPVTIEPTIYPTFPSKGTTDPYEPMPVPPLSLLLGISRRGRPELPKCSNITYWNDDGECQPALCTAGKLPDENGECLSAIEQIRGLGYKLFIVFYPEKPQRVTAEDVEAVADRISERISEISLECNVNTNITVFYNTTLSEGELQKITVTAYFVGNDSVGRDVYEGDLLELFSEVWNLENTGESFINLTIKPAMLGDEFRFFNQKQMENVDAIEELESENGLNSEPHGPNEEDVYDYGYSDLNDPFQIPLFTTPPPRRTSPFLPIHSTLAPTSTTKSNGELKRSKVLYIHRYTTRIDRVALWALKDKFIDVTHSLLCPHVSINTSNTTLNGNFPKFSFLFMGEIVSIPNMKQVSLLDGDVYLCTALYRKLTAPLLMRTSQSTIEKVRYYLEMICVALSVICLLLSALTYCLFPTLRSLPGLNNLSLCLSLAVAQICLLVTAQWGVNEHMSKRYCLIHAILLHYSWLAAFAWMSVCCIHMFRVFTAHDNKFTDNRSDKKRFLHYCVYGFGIPALIVIATISINSSTTSGDSIGYNTNNCFLDTRRSIWTIVLSLLTPLCLIILTNSIMFVLTIKEIIHVTNLQEHRRSRERQGVLTYVKLSTLTGILGAVVVIAVQLDIAVLTLLTSPLMALQGVFIFVSFTCNARVRRLYLDLLSRWGLTCVPEREKTSSTASTAVRTASSSSKVQTASSRI